MRLRFLRLCAVLVMAFAPAACGPELPSHAGTVAAPPHRSWLPEQEPEAVLLALHGFNDYSNAFAAFGDFAAAHGIAVHAYDQAGFGANADAGEWPGIATLVAQLRRECDRLAKVYPDKPLYLLGQSMGAAVVVVAQAEAPLDVAGTILSAPAIWGGDQLSTFYRVTLWLANSFAPGLTLTGEGLDVLASDNIEALRALGRDPLVIKGTRVDAIAGLVRLMDRALVDVDDVPGPLLVLRGARDEIVPVTAHVAMLDRLTAEDCTEVLYAEGYHLLLHDLQRRVVWTDILAWIEGEPLPSGLERSCGGITSVAASLLRS